jgi:Flp pilus assembly protein TadB
MDWMDARLLDVFIGVTGFVVLVILLAVLPLVISAGPAYIIAIVIFILFLSFAGYRVNEKIT